MAAAAASKKDWKGLGKHVRSEDPSAGAEAKPERKRRAAAQQAAWRLKHGLKATVKEMNYIDVAPTTVTPIAGTGTRTLLNPVAQGAARNQRVGSQYWVKEIFLLGKSAPVDNKTIDHGFRVSIVYDRRPTGALPAMTDVLTTDTSASMFNIDNEKRFGVLYDRFWSVHMRDDTATQAYSGGPASCFPVSILIRGLNLLCEMPTAAGAIGDFTNGTGAIYLICSADSGAGTGNYLNFSSRIRFTE